MIAEDNKDKANSTKKITDNQRFKYIGFEVFPGAPKDLFNSETEKNKLIDDVKAKRSKGDILRENCTLLEERVSYTDRLVLTFASLVVFFSLFLPWYSVYNEEIKNSSSEIKQPVAVSDSTMYAATEDSMGIIMDSAAIANPVLSETTEEPQREGVIKESAAEEIIHSYIAKKKIHKKYDRLTGIGTFISLGSIGSYIFSSGGILIITAILLLIYTLLCIGLPAYTMYGLFGLKGNSDQKALALKKILRFNWIPLIVFFLALVLSFFGADYGFDPSELYVSIGSSYGPGTFLGTLSWGIIISTGAFVLVAAKGIEI